MRIPLKVPSEGIMGANDLNLFIFGTQSTAIEILDIATESKKWKSIFLVGKEVYLDEKKDRNEQYVQDENLGKRLEKDDPNFFILSMRDQDIRSKCLRLANSLNLKPTSIISKESKILKGVSIDQGSFIAPFVVISSNVTIKSHCVVHIGSVLGHGCTIEEHVFISPQVTVGGNAKIGKGSYLGSNAMIHQDITIGKHTIVDAQTYVNTNIGNKMICSSQKLKVFPRVI